MLPGGYWCCTWNAKKERSLSVWQHWKWLYHCYHLTTKCMNTEQNMTHREKTSEDLLKWWSQQHTIDSRISTMEQCCALWCQICQTAAALSSIAMWRGAENSMVMGTMTVHLQLWHFTLELCRGGYKLVFEGWEALISACIHTVYILAFTVQWLTGHNKWSHYIRYLFYQ